MIWVLVGTALQTSALHVPHLVVGRVITGVGTGMKSATVPVYQSETCRSSSRGRLVSAEVLFVGVSNIFINPGQSCSLKDRLVSPLRIGSTLA